MARSGDVLENPATGERLSFLRTAAALGRRRGLRGRYPEYSDGA